MRKLIFSVALLAIASVGFHVLISKSVGAARSAKAAALPRLVAPPSEASCPAHLRQLSLLYHGE
jgi:hypothetical protein